MRCLAELPSCPRHPRSYGLSVLTLGQKRSHGLAEDACFSPMSDVVRLFVTRYERLSSSPARGNQGLVRGRLQGTRDASQHDHRNVPLSPFDLADVGAIKPCLQCLIFLRQPGRFSDFLKRTSSIRRASPSLRGSSLVTTHPVVVEQETPSESCPDCFCKYRLDGEV